MQVPYQCCMSEAVETKGKAVESEEKGTSKYPMKEMAEMMKTLVTNQNQQMSNHVAQLNHMQNRLVMMERNNGPRKFHTKQNHMYQKKSPHREPRIPNQLDSTNMVEEVIQWCRPCEQFHQESTHDFAYYVS